MKHIRYYFNIPTNIGTEESPEWKENLFLKTNPYSEANEEIAKREAYNGEYIIEDDGQPDPADNPTEIEALDARLTYVEMMTGLLEV